MQSRVSIQIFLSYAREDEARVKELYEELSNSGFNPWMDQVDLLPGEKWGYGIQQAIQRSSLFLACLSTRSLNKRGFLQKEIRVALKMWQEKLDSDIYLVPVRLENCDVPEKLRKFHWVNLFEKDGFTRLIKGIEEGIKRQSQEGQQTFPENSAFVVKAQPRDLRQEERQPKGPQPFIPIPVGEVKSEGVSDSSKKYRDEEPVTVTAYYRVVYDISIQGSNIKRFVAEATTFGESIMVAYPQNGNSGVVTIAYEHPVDKKKFIALAKKLRLIIKRIEVTWE